MAPAVVARGITKSYGPVVACDGIDLEVSLGSVHALLGENGAGKSSFVKMLFGLSTPDSGSLQLWGQEVSFRSPAEALAAGVGMVQQHFSLATNLTAEENLALSGRLLARVNRRTVREKAQAIADSAGLSIRFGVPVGELGVGEQQRIEIVRALLSGAKLLILDEPTAVLSESESATLLAGVRRLAEQGNAVLLITHRMDDVFEGADHVTVLRAGKVAVDARTASLSRERVVHAITGDELTPYQRMELPSVGEADERGLVVRDLTVEGWQGAVALDGVSLRISPGEIVGMAGVEGNGQRQLCEALVGLRDPAKGTIHLDGGPVDGRKPHDRYRSGIVYVPEDRHQEGLMLGMSVSANLAPGILHRADVVWRRMGVNWRSVRKHYERAAQQFDIRPASPKAIAGTLSGGNQQKVVVARSTAAQPRLVVASQPTRGVDLGAAEVIRQALVDAAHAGAAVLVVSADLDELFAMSHRVVVLARGRVVWEGVGGVETRREIVAAMTGHSIASATSPDAAQAVEVA